MVQKVAVKVVTSRLGFAMRRLENSLCPTSSEWVPFSNEERLRQQRRGMGSAYHQLCPRYSGTLTPTAPTAIMLWETFTLFSSPDSVSIHHNCHKFSFLKKLRGHPLAMRL